MPTVFRSVQVLQPRPLPHPEIIRLVRVVQDPDRFFINLLPQMQHLLAIDFETSYVKDVRDIGSLGVHNYLRHPDTKIYLVSMSDNQGNRYSGPPKGAPWHWITNETTLLSHNRTFDMDVWNVLGFEYWFKNWICTADTSAANQCPRPLKQACQVLLGITPNKDVRDKMSDKDPDQMTPEFWQECVTYAQQDADNCLALYGKLDPLSELERCASYHTTRMSHRGIGVDAVALKKGIDTLKTKLFELQSAIPWFGELDSKGKEIPITSPKAVERECRKLGIPAPDSLAKDSPEFDAWVEQYGEVAPFAKAMGQVRSCNRLLTVLEAMEARRHGDRLYYGLKYFGAQHTGRWSGDNGLNMQNLPKKETFGVDVRSLLVPSPGHAFISADYSQIEARVLPWIAGDRALLELLRQGMDIYEAHARATMGYTDPRPLKEVNPEMRQMSKTRVLGLGFMMGAGTLINYAKTTTGITLSPLQAKKIVNDYRASNRPVTQTWDLLGNSMRRLMIQSPGETMEIKLPSGRTIKYFGVHEEQGMRAQKVRGEAFLWWTPGTLTENCLAGNSEVLTESGWMRIDLIANERVWDGEEWVSHDGLISQGIQRTIECLGLRCTPDHQVLSLNGWVTAEQVCGQPDGIQLVRPDEPITSPRSVRGEGPQPDHRVLSHQSRVDVGPDNIHSSQFEEPTYDLRNCGPRHRFVARGGPNHPALIVHNCVQGIARDILSNAVVNLERARIPVVLHVHDEVLCEVPLDSAEEACQTVKRIMEDLPAWAEGLPLNADPKILSCYEK